MTSPVLESWLERLRALDLDGLVDLYEPEAVLQALRETWIGRSEIRAALAMYGRQLRKLDIDDITPLSAAAGRMAFETRVRGPFGQQSVRHEWLLGPEGIQRHDMAWS